eukprot:4096226-Amphidinium_carterae.1
MATSQEDADGVSNNIASALHKKFVEEARSTECDCSGLIMRVVDLQEQIASYEGALKSIMKLGTSALQHTVRIEDTAAHKPDGSFAYYRDLGGPRGVAGADNTERACPPLVRGCASLFSANTSEIPYNTTGVGLPDTALLFRVDNAAELDAVELLSFLMTQPQELTFSAAMEMREVVATGYAKRWYPSGPQVVWPLLASGAATYMGTMGRTIA